MLYTPLIAFPPIPTSSIIFFKIACMVIDWKLLTRVWHDYISRSAITTTVSLAHFKLNAASSKEPWDTLISSALCRLLGIDQFLID